MLYERTVPLVGHDAVAVRDRSDTVLFFAEHLTRAQRRFLRTHILSIIGDDGPSTVIKVPAGVAASALDRRREVRRRQPHPPLTLTALALSAAAALVAALLVAAAVVLLADVEHGDLTAAQLPGRSPSAERQPVGLGELPPPEAARPGRSVTDRGEAGPARTGAPAEVPEVQGLPPPGLLAVPTRVLPGMSAVPPTSPPGVPPRPVVVPSPGEHPEGEDGAEGRRPVPGGPPVELPDVPGPPEVPVPDGRPEVPDVEAPGPDVDLPDPPGGGVPGGPSDSRPDPGGGDSEPGRDDDDSDEEPGEGDEDDEADEEESEGESGDEETRQPCGTPSRG